MPKHFQVTQAKPYELILTNTELPKEDTDIKVKTEYSCLNYKDALALTGEGKIIRKFPLVPGIDASGVVVESSSSVFPVGSKVLVNGSGFGETRNGGFSEVLYSPENLLVKQTGKLDSLIAMKLGTAGFTAALALHRMLENHQCPEQGPILISGATGGVGSIACILFSQWGFEVHALTGKTDKANYLQSLGASKVVSLESLSLSNSPLESLSYAGVVDSIGGEFLSKILSQVNLFGNVASIGLASGHEIQTSVMPFILRGVSILGISSANTPIKLRREIWERLGSNWFSNKFSELEIHQVGIEDLEKKAKDLLARKISGRVVLKI